MMWEPTPRAYRSLEPFHSQFHVASLDGEKAVHEARSVGYTVKVPGYADPQLIARDVLAAVREIDERVSEELVDQCRVADYEEYSLFIWVTARVKTWPAVPGVTVDPDQDPMRGPAS